MSHSLGQLADNLAAYAIYATAQSEMRHAYALIDAGEYAAAATELDSAARAARAARVLATASASVEPERAVRWRRVAQARARFAEQARERAAEHAALAAYERAERATVHYLADQESFADAARERAVTRTLTAA